MAARFCPECGQEVSSAARFCPNCAARLDGVTSAPGGPPPRVPRPPIVGTPSVTQMDVAVQKSRKLLIPGMVAALVVLAIAVAVLARPRPQPSVLVSAAAPPVAAPAVTNAPTAPPPAAPPLTNAPTAPPVTAPAVTNAATAPAPALPPDVAAYLNFLQQIEQRRIAMNNDTSGAMPMLAMVQGMGGISGGIPDISNDPEGEDEDKQAAAKQDAAKQNMQKVSQGYADYVQKWQGLARDFRAMPPPPPCLTLAARYQTFIGDYTAMITKVQVLLLNNHDQSSMSDLTTLLSTAQPQINTDGKASDDELGNLCGRYGVAKPFTIAPEGASPSLLGH